MVENGRRKDGRPGIDGLCIVTKMNAWKTVKCESTYGEKVEECLTIFWWKFS